MGLTGCYTIQLYCDHPDHTEAFERTRKIVGPGTYRGETEMQCIKEARSYGWAVNKHKEARTRGRYHCLCPAHSGKKVKAR